MSPRRLLLAALFALTLRGGSAWADHPPAAPYAAPEEDDLDASASELRPSIERFVADRRALLRSYPGRLSSAHAGRMERFYRDWLSRLGGAAGHVDRLGRGGVPPLSPSDQARPRQGFEARAHLVVRESEASGDPGVVMAREGRVARELEDAQDGVRPG